MSVETAIDVENLIRRAHKLPLNKQRTLATVLENLENGRDDDFLLEQEIAEFQAAGRPLTFAEKERLQQRYTHV
jgi:hypothetical protein